MRRWGTMLIAALAMTAAVTGQAQSASTNSCCGNSGFLNPVETYFSTWFDRVSRIQAEQPHWVTPLVTVTPRLEEEIRYDQSWQSIPGGHEIDNYGGNKGLELIPFDPIEIIIGVPAYEDENLKKRKNGWTDETFLLKYRIASANEENGNYIVTAFMGLTVPSGSQTYSGGHFIFTPTIAAGKGWGKFDVQSTLGIALPDDLGIRSGPGTPILWNTTLQYHLLKFLWPEVEANYTYWMNGKHEGLNQLFITPGLALGRIPIYKRLGFTAVAGCQIAVTEHPLMNKNVILSLRMPF